MSPQGVIDLFRSEMGDSVEPYLWADEDLFAYLTEAHSQFVRGWGGVADSIEIDVVAGEQTSDLPVEVLLFRRVYYADTRREVELRNIEEETLLAPNYRTGYIGGGLPGAMIIGMVDGSVAWSPVPMESSTIAAVVYRATDVVVEEGNLEQEDLFELPARFHRALVYGMCAQALLKQDAETFDQRRSDQQTLLFAGAIQSAKDERERAQHKPRTIAYGGI